MKYIKKILILIIALGLIVGCSENKEDTQNTENSNQTGGIQDIQIETENNNQIGGIQYIQIETENNHSTTPIITKQEFYGNWIYLDTEENQSIDGNFSYPITRLGNNFIKITKEDNKDYILLRDGTAEGVVRGRLYSDIEHIQKIKNGEKQLTYNPTFKVNRGHRYMVVIDDGFRKQGKIVSDNGNFEFSGLISGNEVKGKLEIIDIEQIVGNNENIENIIENNNTDEENLSEEVIDEITDSLTTENNSTIFQGEIPITNRENDLGNFPIPREDVNYNFKTTQVVETPDEDDRYMYESRTYRGKLKFVNSGTETATALNYEITTDDPYVEELTHDIKMGSVEAGASVEIPFEITFRRLDKIAHRVKLDFLIRDVNNKEWLDYVYIDVYQTPVTVNLKTKTSNLKGYFITPEHEIISINTEDIRVKIPSRPDASYYFLVVSPEDIGAETAYSLGVDVNATDFEDFHNTGAFEPNNLEESATVLEVGDSIKSFIHKGDIDFFTINFREGLSYEPPILPFN